MPDTKKSHQGKQAYGGFTAEERAAMKDHAQELKTAARRGSRATLGFSDRANLDDGTMWPTSYALTELTAAGEARISALVKKAVS
jgi:hypothetical protein